MLRNFLPELNCYETSGFCTENLIYGSLEARWRLVFPASPHFLFLTKEFSLLLKYLKRMFKNTSQAWSDTCIVEIFGLCCQSLHGKTEKKKERAMFYRFSL